MKTYFLHTLLASVIATTASYIHNVSYSKAYLVDFSGQINNGSIAGATCFGCILATLGFFIFRKVLKFPGEVIFTLLFLVLSFLSFYGPYATTLPDSIPLEDQLLFAGLVLPMHLFPALAWFASKTFFAKSYENK